MWLLRPEGQYILLGVLLFLSFWGTYKRSWLWIGLYSLLIGGVCTAYYGLHINGLWIHVIYMALVVVFGTGLGLLFSTSGEGKKKKKIEGDPRFRIELLDDHGKKHYIEDVNSGVAVFAASKGGKTESVIRHIAQHFAQNKFAGFIHDYKDGELSELLYPFYRDAGLPFHMFIPHDPARTCRINVFSPKYLESETHVNGIVKALMLNLSGSVSDDTASFFRGGSESLLAGLVWRLKEAYPQYCTLPHVISIVLNSELLHYPDRPYGRLEDFLKGDLRSSMLASTFLSGLPSERQTAALFSTLSESLRTLVSPELFYALSGDEVDLAVNAPDKRCVISFVNTPGPQEKIYAAVNSTLMSLCLTQMAVRGREPSGILLDEAPRVNIMGLNERVAVMRSYLISFVYCAQDKVQGVSQYGGKEHVMKEIISNLSTQFFGKANDPDSAKFYERYFEWIPKEHLSYSRKSGILDTGDERVTSSKRDESKMKAYEFFQMRKGEFVMFSAGHDDRFRFYYEPPVLQKPPIVRIVTTGELAQSYERIFYEAKSIFNL